MVLWTEDDEADARAQAAKPLPTRPLIRDVIVKRAAIDAIEEEVSRA